MLCRLRQRITFAAGLRGNAMGKQIPSFIGHKRDGLYRRHVEQLNSTATKSLAVEESGTYFYVPAVTAQVWSLPKISSKRLGLEYTLHVAVQASSAAVKINCAYDSSATIKMNYSSIIDDHSSITPGTTLATAITLTAVSSVIWMGQPLSFNSYCPTVTAIDKTSLAGGWTTA